MSCRLEADDKGGSCLHKTLPLLAKFGQWEKLTFYKALNFIRKIETIPWHQSCDGI
jgi:hypothetical protein